MRVIRLVVAMLTMLVLAWPPSALSQGSPVENFDTSGLPPRATSFMEQRLMDMIERHKPGDVPDAVFIQQKLAEYYRQKGDVARARVAEERARSAEQRAAPAQDRAPGRPGGAAAETVVIGSYLCKSMGSQPCSTRTELRLADGGFWGWGRYNGEFEVASGRVRFKGIGGAATWGPAVIGPNTLTFTSGQDTVVWEKPAALRPSLAGVYRCKTAPGGCVTGKAIELRGDGSWSWGSDGGSYAIVGGRVQFSGLSSGPAGWGPADIGESSLTFHDTRGPSLWAKE